MFLGGNKFNQGLENALIIKCYQCGSTNLRYLGGGVTGDYDKPYKCENGHYTWGALDDRSIKGQTDTVLSAVDEGCCVGVSCKFPKKIKVNFSGIIGVQAREGGYVTETKVGGVSTEYQGMSDSLYRDFGSRVSMPYSMCCPCTKIEVSSEVYYNNVLPKVISYSSSGVISIDSDGNINWLNTNQQPRTMWPWRVPAFRTAGYNQLQYQWYIDKDTKLFSYDDRTDAPGYCGCKDLPFHGSSNDYYLPVGSCFPSGVHISETGEIVCRDTGTLQIVDCDEGEEGATWRCKPDYDGCTTSKNYPPCLESGTYKCNDVDSRYRVPCANPLDNYLIDLNNGASLTDIGPYSIYLTDTAYIGGFGLASRCTDLSIMVVAGASNSRPGCNNNVEELTNLASLISNPSNRIEQPHCVRRVQSPSLDTNHRYYAVNTDDISNQTIILDRYYLTGGAVDYQWKDRLTEGPPSGNNISNYGDAGITDYQEGRMYPYPFVSHSGSIEEPEIVAIIHSESGVDGVVAFDTFPVVYDSEQLEDVVYDSIKPSRGSCFYKQRTQVHGYGVKYPYIDDPIWQNNHKNYLTYPIISPGSNYSIGDKIEFRCWKCLEDAADRGQTPGEEESIWGEECIESVIATATITLLNDERLPPTEINQDERLGIISVEVVPLVEERYLETYKVNSIEIVSTGTGGLSVGDRLTIEFTDESLGGVQYSEYPEIGILEVDEDGKVLDYEIIKNGEFWKVIRTGGIRWYEFDEVDNNTGDLLISVGNCPCDYDMCASPYHGNMEDYSPNTECIGCLSRDIYPNTHNKIDALPRTYIDESDGVYAEQFVGDPSSTYSEGVLPGKFPAFPNFSCISIAEEGGLSPVEYCRHTSSVDCDQTCYREIYCDDIDYTPTTRTPFLFPENDCPPDKNCICLYNDEGNGEDSRIGDIFPSTCSCGTNSPFSFGRTYVGPHSMPENNSKCFPLNRTWEWYPQNYARVACSGDPVIEETRPYVSGTLIIPPRQAQYKYQWLPKVQETVNAIETWYRILYPKFEFDENIAAAKESFLLNSSEGCNPLRLDIQNKSYKFPNPRTEDGFIESFLDPPCRKHNSYNPLHPSLSGVYQNDNYCRVYGFYQQIQPTCDIVYKGQYIMRAAEKNEILGVPIQPLGARADMLHGTDCEPLIEDITITLSKNEAKFDVSVGAPYNQDYLIPENLPLPTIGPDGKLESSADPWHDPSLVGSSGIMYDHGMYSPLRRYFVDQEIIPGESVNDQDPFFVNKIKPLETMYPVDGLDYYTDNNDVIHDLYNKGSWDLPDPRSNIRVGTSGLDLNDSCINPVYSGLIFEHFPATGLRNAFVYECPYPWEDNCQGPSDCEDYFCMFQNNSAEITLGEIEQCEYCSSNEILKTHKGNSVIVNFFRRFLFRMHYTHIIPIDSVPTEDVNINSYFVFRCYGDATNSFNQVDFVLLLNNYIDVWVERMDIDTNLTLGQRLALSFQSDLERSIFWNFIFQGANNNQLENLTKVEVYLYKTRNDPDTNALLGIEDLLLLYEEKRCDVYKVGGGIKSLNVINPGNGYAFEVEERVPCTGVKQVLESGIITINQYDVVSNYRRRESYGVADVSIEHSGTGYSINDQIEISFEDEDYRRDGIYVTTPPVLKVTDVNDSGTIIDWEILESGEFYKYTGTGEHRAFPISILLNNYWTNPSNPNDRPEIGRHALFRPVVGIDPSDKKTYGKIKRIEVEYEGINYVVPTTYWTIDTKAGKYDEYGNLISGLDIQHLVDPCKYSIQGSGMSPEDVAVYRYWLGFPTVADDYIYNTTNGEALDEYIEASTLQFPDKMDETRDPNFEVPAFVNTTKYYYHTGSDTNGQIIRWEDKVEDWSSVIDSGSCPFGAAGLLNRTYKMALVEESSLTAQGASSDGFYPWRPHVGVCSDNCGSITNSGVALLCNLFDINDCANQPDNPPEEPPGEEDDPMLDEGGEVPVEDSVPPCEPIFSMIIDEYGGTVADGIDYGDCGSLGCNVYTVYDAHRFPLMATNRFLGSYGSQIRRRPKIQGCFEPAPVSDVWCGSVGVPNYLNIQEFGADNDKCHSAEYSLFAEFSTVLEPNNQQVNYIRAKTITYKMKDPITMNISFFDEDHQDYIDSLTCPSGINGS
jgi:hypothetical protein